MIWPSFDGNSNGESVSFAPKPFTRMYKSVVDYIYNAHKTFK